MNDQKKIIFLHIPKAAGTTLQKILLRQYDPTLVYMVDHELFVPERRRPAARGKGEQGFFFFDGEKAHKCLKALRQIPGEQQNIMRVLYGHLPFGLDRFLEGSAIYLTMLRDPVDRIISHYYFCRSRPKHYLYRIIREKELNLREYVERKVSWELHNGQTSMLAGISEDGMDPYPPFTETVKYQRAVRHLKRDDVLVGLTERFDESINMFRKELGWKWPFYIPRNASRKPLRHEIDGKTRKVIERFNGLDRELYEEAKRLVFRHIRRNGYVFQVKCHLFKAINALRQARASKKAAKSMKMHGSSI